METFFIVKIKRLNNNLESWDEQNIKWFTNKEEAEKFIEKFIENSEINKIYNPFEVDTNGCKDVYRQNWNDEYNWTIDFYGHRGRYENADDEYLEQHIITIEELKNE